MLQVGFSGLVVKGRGQEQVSSKDNTKDCLKSYGNLLQMLPKTDRQTKWGKMPQMSQAIEQNVQCIGIIYFQGVVSVVPKTSLAPTLQDIATPLSYPSELDVTIQFRKTLHTLL